MNKISIALCTYNGASFLSDQLESFLEQTVLPDELVICDDGSTDETAEIIDVFSKSATFPVRFYVNEKNLGSTANFEKAVKLCGGDIIFLSDQDDVWNAEKIELMRGEFAKSESVGLVFSNGDLVDENLKPLERKLWDFAFPSEERKYAANNDLFEVILRKNVVTGAATAFRRKYLEAFLPIPTDVPNMIHDAWIALAISAVADVIFIDKPLIKYRQHSQQQMGIDWKYLRESRKINRFNHYANSIKYELAELEKFPVLFEVLKSRPTFEKKLAELDTESLIEQFSSECREKILHYKARQNLSSSKLKRIIPVFRELLSGRYHHFSKGFKSGAKDILENW